VQADNCIMTHLQVGGRSTTTSSVTRDRCQDDQIADVAASLQRKLGKRNSQSINQSIKRLMNYCGCRYFTICFGAIHMHRVYMYDPTLGVKYLYSTVMNYAIYL